MVMKRIFGVALFAAAASVCAGTDDSVTYEEVALGATMDEYAAKLPDHRCRPAEGVCRFVLEQCRRARPARPPNDCATRNAFIGAQVTTATADFRDGRLVSLSFTLDPAQTGRLMTAVEERFGRATQADEGPVGLSGGRQLSRRNRVWTRNDWEMRVEQNSGRLERGFARLTAAKEVERQDAARAERGKEPAKGS